MRRSFILPAVVLVAVIAIAALWRKHHRDRLNAPTTCRESRDCEAYGECGGSLGDCRAVRDEDCRASDDCAADAARCALHPDGGGCAPGPDADCRHTKDCRESGGCHSRDG